MKKTAALLTLVLTLGFTFNASAQQAYNSLNDAAHGGHQNGWNQPFHGGHDNGHNDGHNGDHHDGPPMPPPPHPEPWHPGPGPQPGPQQNQNFQLISIGSYSTSSDAENAKNEVVRVLGERGILVMEARVDYNAGYRFTITYNAREQLNVVQYHAGSYSTSSDARAAADKTSAALKAQGRVVIETPVFYNAGYTYTVAYVNMKPGPQQPDQFQKFSSIGAYSTSSDASASRDAAVTALGDIGLVVLEARVEYNAGYRFVITYALDEEVPVEQYHGGSYSTSSDARAAADQAAATMKARGKAVVETNVFYNAGYTFTVAYINLYQGHHQHEDVQTLPSIGSYSTSSDADKAKTAAVSALGGLRLTVMEARVFYNAGYRFEVKYLAREPLNVQQYKGGSYSTSSAAAQGAAQTAAALTTQGNAVVETSVFYNAGYTYTVAYASSRW